MSLTDTEVLAQRPASSGVLASVRSWGGRAPALVGAAVFLLVMGAYWITISPTTHFWDSGEFIAASYIMGLPHPPGTPLYIVVGRLFSMLPFDEAALGVNLLSALSGALAALFLHLTVVRIVRGWGQPGEPGAVREIVAQVSGVAAALFAAFGSTYWTNSIEAEVYAPSSFLQSLTMWMMVRWGEDPARRGNRNLLLVVAYLLSLGIGYHLGTYLMAPCFLCFILAVEPQVLADARTWLGGLAVTVAGLSIHLVIPLRSMHNPPIDENNPETLANFLYYIGRKQYKPTSIFDRQADWSFQFDHFWRYFTEQFPVGLAILGVLGLAAHAIRHRKTFILVGSAFLITGLGLIIYMNFTATEVRERDYFYTQAFFTYAAWIGMGLGMFVETVWGYCAGRGRLGRLVFSGAGAFALAVCFIPLQANWFTHDRRGDYVAHDYGYNLLVGLDQGAIIFTNGDNDTFPLWFMQEVKKFRKDVRVVNLSLLNTDWYIWQLKHIEPKVPMSIPDEQLPFLRPYRTEDNRIIYVRDIAMFDIINTTGLQQPIYFAVTVPGLDEMGLMDHLVLEGLAFKMVEKKSSEIDLARLEENLLHKFRFRGILTPDGRLDRDVYRDENTTNLITNYSAALIRMAMAYAAQERFPEAVRVAEMCGTISPEYPPYLNIMGPLYAQAGDYLKAEEFLKTVAARSPNSAEVYLHLGYTYEGEGREEDALAAYRKAIEIDPNQAEAYRRAAQQLYRLRRTGEAIDLLERWISLHPEDTSTQRALQILRGESSGAGAAREPAAP